MRDAARRVLVLGAFVAVETGLRLLPLPVLGRLCGVRMVRAEAPSSSATPTLPWWAGERVRLASRVARRWPFEGPCLREALVVGALLRRWSPVLRIGVAHSDAGALRAHAWVEVAGATYDPQARSFARLEVVA